MLDQIKEAAAAEIRATLFAEMISERGEAIRPGDVTAGDLMEQLNICRNAALIKLKEWPKTHPGWTVLKVWDNTSHKEIWVLRKV